MPWTHALIVFTGLIVIKNIRITFNNLSIINLNTNEKYAGGTLKILNL